MIVLPTHDTDTNSSNQQSEDTESRKDMIRYSSQEVFSAAITEEFCTGSAIAPSLFHATTSICADLEYGLGREPITPIHDALNWRYTRFGAQAKQSLYAILLLNETGECWQAKLSHPRIDTKDKIVKYETPVGNGARLFLPTVSPDIRQRIADRYRISVPMDGSFWDWIAQNPGIPRIWTEGGKKALALLSQGYVGIALLGVNGGYRKVADIPTLIPDAHRFATAGTHHILAFDADEKPKTVQRVTGAIARFGTLLKESGGDVNVAHWQSSLGKGIDDVIVQAGATALNDILQNKLPLSDWHLWQRLEHRLTHPAALRTTTADLSELDTNIFPKEGIVAIAAPKGTGKTKLQCNLLQEERGALALSHRVTLCRNLCERMGLDYRGDILTTKTLGVSEDGVYRIGIGSCVDALLAIDPGRFFGCDLFIDEVVQVVRHLLTSSTCAQDGKRPALLARFHELIKIARRVIVADADLDSATLQYLADLRGKTQTLFLVQNDYHPKGYPVTLLNAPDKTDITSRLLKDAKNLPDSKTLLITTDSKRSSKMLAELLTHQLSQHQPSRQILLINAETSNGQEERHFIQNPDELLTQKRYSAVIVSPSMATGVSIEAQDIIYRVYGIFSGVSLTDADMAQALSRVRQPVERIVWCNQRGSNYSKISRSPYAETLKHHLQTRTSATVSLVRSSLREDTANRIDAYDWQTDPHLNLFVHLEAERNRSMANLRDALRIRLMHEGNHVIICERETDKAAQNLLKQAKERLKTSEAEAIAHAPNLTLEQRLVLESKENLTLEEKRQLQKARLQDFYALESVTPKDVLFDGGSRRQREITNLESLLYPTQAVEKTVKSIQRQDEWTKEIIPWDISPQACQQWLRAYFGLQTLIDPNKTWSRLDLENCAQRIRERATDVQLGLNFTVTPTMSNVQIVHQLLSQVGIKVTFKWSRTIPGLEGKKEKLYRIDEDHWKAIAIILERRKHRRERWQDPKEQTVTSKPHSPGSPPLEEKTIKKGGDPDIKSLPVKSKNTYNDGMGDRHTNQASLQIKQKPQETSNSPLTKLDK